MNDFKQMQVEMRAMISGNKSPDKVPLKLKQQGLLSEQGRIQHKVIGGKDQYSSPKRSDKHAHQRAESYQANAQTSDKKVMIPLTIV